MLFNVLLQLALFAVSAVAFYPYYPEYKCVEDGKCLGMRNRGLGYESVQARQGEEGIFTVKLKKVNRAESLRKNRVSRDSKLNSLVGKRENTYKIVSSANPSEPYSAAVDQDGTDFSYLAVVQLGSKQKSLYLLLDTGASSSWVMGSTCKSDACPSHNSFGPSDSTTYNVTTSVLDISYGTGKVTGMFVSDTLSFAGFSMPVAFGVADTVSNDFLSFPMDGILGLAQLPSGNGNNPPTFIESLVASKVLKANLFGFNINRYSDGTNDGEINFGAPNPSKYTGDLNYIPLTNPGGAWDIAVGDAGFNGKMAGFKGKKAVIDSGTSYCFLPEDDAKAFYATIPFAVKGSGAAYSVPCDTTTPLQFAFGGVTYEISAKDWVGGKVGSSCTSNIYGRDAVGDGRWLLGDTFMKNVYTVFDIDQNRIGFGMKSTPVKISPSASGMTILSSIVTSSSLQSSSDEQPSDTSTGSTLPSSTISPDVASASSSSGLITPIVSTIVSTDSTVSVLNLPTGVSQGFIPMITSSNTPSAAVASPQTAAESAAAATPSASSAASHFNLRISLYASILAVLAMVV